VRSEPGLDFSLCLGLHPGFLLREHEVEVEAEVEVAVGPF